MWGTVRSQGGDKETLLEAQILVLGRKAQTVTDVDGRYRLELPPGTYSLRVVYDLHKPVRVRNVRVVSGRVAKLDIALEPDENATEETVAVEAEVERASTSTQLMLRKNAATASDAVGAQEIAKSPDRNAADAIRRVVGASVVDGKYVLVRGLGDRYMAALLNSSPLPSPEPDRQAVPLDMFPTLVLSDLVIKKTFTPDMPGDFAGGLLDIHTREFPSKFLFVANLGMGINKNATFQNRLSYPGGSLDWLGFDDGNRRLPSEFPDDKLVEIDPNTGRRRDLTPYGKALTSDMETEPAFTLPNGNGSFVMGQSWKTGDKSSLGVLAGASYARRFLVRKDGLLRTYNPPDSPGGELKRLNEYEYETGTDAVTWSALGQVGYTFNDNHKIIGTGLYSRNAEKEGRIIQGTNEEQGGQTIRDERLRFVARGLAYGQLRGEHRFRDLNSSVFEWRALYARATLDDPKLRETIYGSGGQPPVLAFRDGTQSGQHFFASQGETSRAAGVDYTQPLNHDPERPHAVKFGGLASLRSRSFDARRFRFIRIDRADNADVFRNRPNDLFRPENIGTNLQLEEWTQRTDSYTARYDVLAGYAMTDLAISRRLRLIVGERVEVANQTIDSFDPFSGVATDASSSLKKVDLLPSVSTVLKLSDRVNLRAAAFQTVARPQLRELAPFIFTDFLGAREMIGNPSLDRTKVVNFDLRLEFFPSPLEVLAISVFHKEFIKPIEPTVLPTGRGVITFDNAKGATNTGVEIEARKKLGFVTSALDEFTLVMNATFLYSNVDIAPEKSLILTSSSRPLAGQSPFVVNAALDWEHEKTKTRARVLYNVAGPRVAQVGAFRLPDFYEQPRHVVDASVAQSVGDHIDLKLSVENLLDAPYRFTQGSGSSAPLTERYRLGQTAWLSASYTF